MKLDCNYNIKSADNNIYSDSFDEIVDLIVQAKEKGKLNDEEARLLLSFAIKKQNKKEIKGFFDLFFNSNKQEEKQTLFTFYTIKNQSPLCLMK